MSDERRPDQKDPLAPQPEGLSSEPEEPDDDGFVPIKDRCPLHELPRPVHPPVGWLFLSTDAVPERWRDRAVPVAMVPLLPGEAAQLLAEGSAEPEVDATDHMIVVLAAEGITIDGIARRVGMSPRGVQLRLARLRDRLRVGSTMELRTLLARRGF